MAYVLILGSCLGMWRAIADGSDAWIRHQNFALAINLAFLVLCFVVFAWAIVR